MLIDYPHREYPENEELDPKNKKKVPAKKKKKKDTFPTPEWAEDLTAVTDKVKLMNDLVADRANLKLNDEFLGKVKEEMDRFKKEISFRRQMEEEARIEAELKAAKRNKKPKK